MRDPRWLEADRRWQQRHPRRRFRLRRMDPTEYMPADDMTFEHPTDPVEQIKVRAQIAATGQGMLNADLPPGFEPAVIVYNYGPGVRFRFPVPAPSRLIALSPDDQLITVIFGRALGVAFETLGMPAP